jgi:hypothetical protein
MAPLTERVRAECERLQRQGHKKANFALGEPHTSQSRCNQCIEITIVELVLGNTCNCGENVSSYKVERDGQGHFNEVTGLHGCSYGGGDIRVAKAKQLSAPVEAIVPG